MRFLVIFCTLAVLLCHHVGAININRRQGARAKKSSVASTTTTTTPVEAESTQKLTLTQMYSQIQSLSDISKKMLKRLQVQNEEAGDKLNECYNQLGKHTRLMIVNNKRRALKDLGSGVSDASGLFDNQTVGDDNSFYLNEKESRESQLNMNSIILHRDLNYYLSELERNYNVIQDLQIKLQTMNNSEKIVREPQEDSDKPLVKKNENDCSQLNGNGFVQIEVRGNNDDYSNTRDPLMTIKDNKMTVYCENSWLVIQQRQNGFETNFNRSWAEYSKGFGSLRGDFWLGLETISTLTQQRQHKLLIELTDWSDQVFIAQYDSFEIGSEQDSYRLSLSGSYTGNASKDFLDDLYNGLMSQNGAFFSTYDQKRPRSNLTYTDQGSSSLQHISKLDNGQSLITSNSPQYQKLHNKNCALRSGGGWWFNNFTSCLPVNLNGIYVTGASAPSMRGIKWQSIRPSDRNYALKKSKMKIKPAYSV